MAQSQLGRFAWVSLACLLILLILLKSASDGWDAEAGTDGILTSVDYSATPRILTTSAAGRQSYSRFDERGRLIEVGMNGIAPITLGYDTGARVTSLAQGSGAATRTMTVGYGAAGQLQSVTDPLGRTARLDRDRAGRVIALTLANGERIGLGYDARGNLTSLTPPGRPAHAFTYDAVDLTTGYTPPTVHNAGETGYQYNAGRQLTRVTRPDGGVLDFAYDAAGRLSTLTIPAGQYSYGYNAADRLNRLTAPGGVDLAYDYDGAWLAAATWSGGLVGSVEFGHDADLRLSQISVNGANPVGYRYDEDGLLIQTGDLTLAYKTENNLLAGRALGGVTDHIDYNGFGEPIAYEAGFYGAALLRIDYPNRDKLGRINRKVERVGAEAPVTYDYSYDAIGQLVEVKRNGELVATYVYDANGNRLSKATPGGTVTGNYDDQDRMLSYGNATYTYTANGELKTKTVGGQTTTYDYDALGNLRGVILPDGRRVEYLIDARNRRVVKKINGALIQGFLYQGQLKPIAELDGTGAVVSRFVYANGVNVPDYMIRGGNTYRIIKDHLGSPRLVVSTATGAIAQRMDYDEHGYVLIDTNPGFQPFGFAGGGYDRDSGLVRFGARDYEAGSGRWMAKDLILFEGRDTGLYSYAFSNPILYKDSEGRDNIEYTHSAGGPINNTGVYISLECFGACAGVDLTITGATEKGHSKGSKHETGDACDIRKKDIPSNTARECFNKCFQPTTDYGQEESDHYHFQGKPGRGDAVGFAK